MEIHGFAEFRMCLLYTDMPRQAVWAVFRIPRQLNWRAFSVPPNYVRTLKKDSYSARNGKVIGAAIWLLFSLGFLPGFLVSRPKFSSQLSLTGMYYIVCFRTQTFLFTHSPGQLRNKIPGSVY
jgi:hypothetical protein